MGRPHITIVACVLAALGIATESAEASCRSGNFRFTFGQSAPVDTTLTMTQPSCNWTFGGGAYVSYESITVVRRASNLTVSPLSNGFGINIRARDGFRGRDAFSLRTCGRFRAESGCVTVNFAVTVQ
jgi:hypothetical protein